MIILGIESSCDDTAVALVQNGRKVLGSLVSSQVKLHRRFGGVVPEVASRKHLENILPIIERLLRETKTSLNRIDAIAVTSGPGLSGSLLVGVNTAKALAYIWQKPLIEVDHLAAHIYSNFIEKKLPLKFPMLALIVSGGHTELVLIKSRTNLVVVGATLDDAAGEAFDKAAKLLGLGYPGGPAIAKAAVMGKVDPLPRPMLEQGLNMSFSGLKTALGRAVGSAKKSALAYEFQEAVTDVLATKVTRAIRRYRPKALLLAGGVAANKVLREKLKQIAKKHNLPYYIPEFKYCMDNAAMVALAAYFLGRTDKRGWYNVEVKTNSWKLKYESRNT
ncbi:tRNA (adenosine(37)-N6)-threonylcarbamoyltransferase complex transferase subunit TsaD [Patescibacteria group bacterium]|nr:tRNA (adenosine(37)-N6)-threonylcarbamoyltransferase complex transferase subunit TsaD [Patescibacteria group bacterium]